MTETLILSMSHTCILCRLISDMSLMWPKKQNHTAQENAMFLNLFTGRGH